MGVCHFAVAGLSAAVLVVLAPRADAVSITNLTTVLGAANGANQLTASGTNFSQRTSLSEITSSVSGVIPTFTTRYALQLAADSNSSTGVNMSHVAAYTVAFDVVADPGQAWVLQISTFMRGSLNLVGDNTGHASADISAVTGSSNLPLASGSLNLADTPGVGIGVGGNGGTASQVISPTGFGVENASISGIGSGLAQSVTLNFGFTAFANSPGDSSTIFGDEAAVRLGLGSQITGAFTAGDYPGSPTRILANDGHFATVKLTGAVPEPSTLVLLGAGLAGLALLRRGSGA